MGYGICFGPNINLPMDAGVVHTAYEAVQKAITLLDNETQKEKDLVMTLSKRYLREPPKNRTPLDSAYFISMRELHQKYPDHDVATMLQNL